jgi:hypothetical protein
MQEINTHTHTHTYKNSNRGDNATCLNRLQTTNFLRVAVVTNSEGNETVHLCKVYKHTTHIAIYQNLIYANMQMVEHTGWYGVIRYVHILLTVKI